MERETWHVTRARAVQGLSIVTGACLGLPWVRRVEGWPGPEQDEGPGDILQGGHGAEIE